MNISKIKKTIPVIMSVVMLSGCSAPNIPLLNKKQETAPQPTVSEEQVSVEEAEPSVDEMNVNITAPVGSTITIEDAKSLLNEQLLVQGVEGEIDQLYLSCDDTGDVNASEIAVIEGKHIVQTLFTIVGDEEPKTSKFVYEGVVTDDSSSTEVNNDFEVIPNENLVLIENTDDAFSEKYSELKENGLIESGVTFSINDIESSTDGAGFVEDIQQKFINVTFSDEFTEEEKEAYLNEHTEIVPVELTVSVTDINNENRPRYAEVSVHDASGKIYCKFGTFLQGMEDTLGLDESKYVDLFAGSESTEDTTVEETEKKEDTEETTEEKTEEEELLESPPEVESYDSATWTSVAKMIAVNLNNFDDLYTVKFLNDPVYITKDTVTEVEAGDGLEQIATDLADSKTSTSGVKTYKQAHPELYVWPKMDEIYSRWDWRITDSTSIIGTITLADGSTIPAEQSASEGGYSLNFANGGNTNLNNTVTGSQLTEIISYLTAGANKIKIVDSTGIYASVDNDASTSSIVEVNIGTNTYCVEIATKEQLEARKSSKMYDEIPDDFDLTSESADGENGLRITTYSVKVDSEEHPYIAAAKYDDNYYIICYNKNNLVSTYNTSLYDILSKCVDV